jgi:hypothetical protein
MARKLLALCNGSRRESCLFPDGNDSWGNGKVASRFSLVFRRKEGKRPGGAMVCLKGYTEASPCFCPSLLKCCLFYGQKLPGSSIQVKPGDEHLTFLNVSPLQCFAPSRDC